MSRSTWDRISWQRCPSIDRLLADPAADGNEADKRLPLSVLDLDKSHLGRLPEAEEAASVELLSNVIAKALQIEDGAVPCLENRQRMTELLVQPDRGAFPVLVGRVDDLNGSSVPEYLDWKRVGRVQLEWIGFIRLRWIKVLVIASPQEKGKEQAWGMDRWK